MHTLMTPVGELISSGELRSVGGAENSVSQCNYLGANLCYCYCQACCVALATCDQCSTVCSLRDGECMGCFRLEGAIGEKKEGKEPLGQAGLSTGPCTCDDMAGCVPKGDQNKYCSWSPSNGEHGL